MPPAGYRKPVLADQEDYQRKPTSSRKGITLKEIREALIDRGIEGCSLTTIWSTLRRIDLSFGADLR